MRERDLKQISQLRKLREDEKEKALVRARAEQRQAEQEFIQTYQQHQAIKLAAVEDEKRRWKELSAQQELSGDALSVLYQSIDDYKKRITERGKQVTQKGVMREARKKDAASAQQRFMQAQRDKDRWQNLRDKLTEERIRKEEIALEELNSEIRLKKAAALRKRTSSNHQ